MAGGGGSTGGIGAQSPAVNPPNPMGQIGNAVGGALGGGAQQTTPAYGPSTIQTGQFGSQPIPMGNNLAYNGQPQGSMGGMAPDYATTYPAPSGFGQSPQQPPPGFNSVQPGFGQPPMETPTMDSQIRDSMQQAQAREQTLSPTQMAEMQQAFQAARQAPQQGQGQMGLGQAAQTGALTQQQMSKLGGLAALLGGNPTPPTPAVSAPPTARPAPVASKSTTKTSVVPSKTPPAVASAIQKLAAKKQARTR